MDRYATLRRGLIGAWCPSLGATGYTLLDRSGRNNHGTLTNMGGQNNWSSRSGGLAIQFDGSNDRVSIPSAVSVSTTAPFTISLWAWTNNLTTQVYPHLVMVFTRDAGAIVPFEIAVSAQPGYVGILFGSINAVVNWGNWRAGPNWTSNRWNHVTVTYNGGGTSSGSNYAVFYNGNPFPVGSASAFSPLTNATTLGGPAGGGTSNFLFGFLDDVRLYDRVLTRSEIALLASQRGIGLVPARHRRASLLAQFWLNVAGTWKTAKPWINVGGTWRQGSPKIRAGGAWKG